MPGNGCEARVRLPAKRIGEPTAQPHCVGGERLNASFRDAGRSREPRITHPELNANRF
jgi:hypothetical protein